MYGTLEQNKIRDVAAICAHKMKGPALKKFSKIAATSLYGTLEQNKLGDVAGENTQKKRGPVLKSLLTE